MLKACEVTFKDVLFVNLHVQVNNDDAVNFYKKFGFTVHSRIADYYKRVEPRDCFLLRKDIRSAPVWV